MEFCLNSKTGNLLANDKHCIYSEKYGGSIYFYIKKSGKKCYLTQKELAQLKKAAKYFIENCGCDFGEHINTLIKQEYLH